MNDFNDAPARAWLNDLAFVAENMPSLGHAITEQEAYWFKRISQICSSCMVGNEWAEFRRLLPQKRAQFVNDWMIDAKVPRLVRERFDNAVRDWYGASGREPQPQGEPNAVSKS
jgi:hypothetical protein